MVTRWTRRHHRQNAVFVRKKVAYFQYSHRLNFFLSLSIKLRNNIMISRRSWLIANESAERSARILCMQKKF